MKTDVYIYTYYCVHTNNISNIAHACHCMYNYDDVIFLRLCSRGNTRVSPARNSQIKMELAAHPAAASVLCDGSWNICDGSWNTTSFSPPGLIVQANQW